MANTALNNTPSVINRPPLKGSVWLEIGAFLVCIGYLFFHLRKVLFLGTATLAHDNLFWTLPVFTYFAEGIGNGVLPLWNPFSHGGEPLAHVYLTTRLLDPVSIAVAWLGQLVTSDLVLLANWDRVAKMLLTAFGAYLLLRQWTNSVLVRLALVPALVLSNFTANAFWQPGILDQFVYVPFFLIFLLNLLWKRDYRAGNWVGAAVFFGASLQSYFFVGPSLIAALLLLGFVLFRRDDVRALLKAHRNGAKALLALLILVAMAGPQMYLYRDLDRFDLPAREDVAGKKHSAGNVSVLPKVGMSYETIQESGAFSQLQDFLGLLVPGLLFLRRTSEAGLYLGGLVFLGALYGLAFASHPLKRIWMLVGASVGLLMLGPLGGLHWLLYHVFPPLWFLRHTEQLVGLFQLAVLFFFVIGADAWLQHWRHGNVASSPPQTGPLGRWLGDHGRARAIAILATMGMMLMFVPYLARWGAEQPMAFGLTSLTLLGIGAIIYLLRRDLGPRAMASTIALGMFALTALLSHRPGAVLTHTSGVSVNAIEIYFQVWLYSGIFVLAPLVLIHIWRRNHIDDTTQSDSAGSIDKAATFGIALIGVVTFLFISIGFFYLPLDPGMSIDRILAHIVLVILASLSALGALHARWLVFIVPILYTRLTAIRFAAGLICIVLLIPAVYPIGEDYFNLHAFIYFDPIKHYYSTKSFFYFHWLGLITASAVITARPRLLPNMLSGIQSTADPLRFIMKASLVFGLVPAMLIANKVFSSGYTALQLHEIVAGGAYVVIAVAQGGTWLWAALKNKWPHKPTVDEISRSFRAPGYFLPSVLVIWVALDLAVSMTASAPDILGLFSKHLWHMHRPDGIYITRELPGKPVYPSHRAVTSPVSSDIGRYLRHIGQEIRYADLFARVPAMLDPPMDMNKRAARESSAVQLDELLGADRNSGFIQLRSYNELLRSGQHPDILAEIFSLDRSLIQFRPCAESKEAFLRQVRSQTPEAAVALLRRAVILDTAPQKPSHCQDRETDENRFMYKVLGYNYDTVRLRIDAPTDGYLYYADGYDPHWLASVDQAAVPLRRANFNFKAVAVKKGKHDVEFRYAPTTLRFLIGLYFAVFLLGLAAMAALFTRARVSG